MNGYQVCRYRPLAKYISYFKFVQNGWMPHTCPPPSLVSANPTHVQQELLGTMLPTRFSWKGICLYLLEFVGTVKYLLVFVGMFNYLLVFVWIIGIFEVFVSICWYLFKFSRYFFVSICICLHFQCICWYVFVVTGTSNVFVCIC